MLAVEDHLHRFRTLYRTSPHWVKATIGWAYSQIPRRVRYGPELERARSLLAESARWPKHRLEEYQWNQLKQLLDHAYENVPYYRRTWRALGISPGQIRAPDDLARLPLLSKEDVRLHREELVAENYRNRLLVANTGGSTGQPLEFYWERGRTRALERAFMWRQWEWAGFRFGDRTAVLRGQTVHEGIHFDPIDRHLFLSGLKLGDDSVATILKALREFRPVSLQAYPSSATVLANYMSRNDEPPIDGLKVVLCGSENLYPAQRTLLESVFRCRVYSWYGMGESVCLAGGCDLSDDYHVYHEYGFTELIDREGQRLAWAPGTRGEIVGTGFNNWAMPLIRYRTGDVAVAGAPACSCGRGYPLWERIEGRQQEYVVGHDGALVPLTAFIFGQHYHAFERILRLQVVQERVGSLIIRLVVVPEWSSEDESRLRSEMHQALGAGWDIAFQYVDSIATTTRGKHRFVVQHLQVDDLWSGRQEPDHR